MKIQWPKIDTRPLWKRLGLALTVAAGAVAAQIKTTGAVPHSLTDLAPALVLGGLAAFPAGSAPAGLITPTASGAPSVAQAVGQAVSAIANAPRAMKQQATTAAIVENLPAIAEAVANFNKTNVTGFAPGELAVAPVETATDDAAHAALEDAHAIARMEGEGAVLVAPVTGEKA